MMLETLYLKVKNNKFLSALLFVYVFVLLFFCSQMSPLYPYNTWSDVNVYFNVGKAIFEGRTLYTEIFDHKGPLIFIIYGFGYLISNDSFLGLFLFELIGWCFMSLAVFFSVKLYLKKEYAFIVTLLFPLFFFKFSGSGGSPEEFILIFFTCGFYFFTRYFQSSSSSLFDPRHMLLIGVLCSMTFFCKMNLLVYWFFPLIGIFIDLLRKKEYRNLWINLGVLVAGILIIALPIIVYLWANDALEEAYNVYVVLNKEQSEISLSIGSIINKMFSRGFHIFKFNIITVSIIIIGMFYFPIKHLNNLIGKISFLLSAITLYMVIFITQSFHFYYPLPLCIYILPGLIAVFCFINNYITISYSQKLLSFCAILCLIIGITAKDQFGMGGNVLLRRGKPNNLVSAFEAIIMKEKNPTLVNLSHGDTNTLFTVCNIIPNVKYFFRPNLIEEKYPQMRNEQTKYIENKTAQFIVLTNFTPNKQYFENLPALRNNYELVKTYVDKSSYSSETIAKQEYYLYKRKD